MKTIKNFNLKNSLSISFAAFALLLASCKKDDLATTSANESTKSASAKYAMPGQAKQSTLKNITRDHDPKIKEVFSMITIDHIAARTHAPDYCVTVKSDATVIFEGRRNVALVGTKEWKLNAEQFHALKDMFEHSGFNSIEDNLSLLADVPMVSTTWSNSLADFSRTLIDYNQGYPEALISLRNKAEDMLDLSKYVNRQTVEAITIADQ